MFRLNASIDNRAKWFQGHALLAALPLLLAACAVQQRAPQNAEPVAAQQVLPATIATTPGQDALLQAERKEVEREDEQGRKARAEREKNLHLKLVQTMIDQDNAYAALAHLDAYDQKWGADRPARQLRADALRKTNQLDQAEVVYKSLLSSQGQQGPQKNGAIWYGLGKVAIEKGDLKTATTRLEKSVQIDPLNINAYSDLGLVYLLDGQKEPAYNTLMKANQLASGDSKVMANLALWGLVFDDFNMAMDIADRLKWSDKTRNQVMAQANTIKRRFDARGSAQ
ncbi:MAG TPA: tetratricopeptide repeat protein [Limnobacter sp.]|nr:tetratricopeptide repeat protein [Limnobacter sp.]